MKAKGGTDTRSRSALTAKKRAVRQGNKPSRKHPVLWGLRPNGPILWSNTFRYISPGTHLRRGSASNRSSAAEQFAASSLPYGTVRRSTVGAR
jgi:hypothetical protein